MSTPDTFPASPAPNRAQGIARRKSSQSATIHETHKCRKRKPLHHAINAAYRESSSPSTSLIVKPSTFNRRSSVSVVIDARDPDNQRWSVTRWTLAARAIEAIDSPAASLMAIARRTAGRAISIRFIIPRRALRRDGDCCHALPCHAMPSPALPRLAIAHKIADRLSKSTARGSFPRKNVVETESQRRPTNQSTAQLRLSLS